MTTQEELIQEEIDDVRFTFEHVRIYSFLVSAWISNRFENPFEISFVEIMNSCKIESIETYTKCLEDLVLWQYIHYTPSNNGICSLFNGSNSLFKKKYHEAEEKLKSELNNL
jgi:hypothetical protein